MKTDDTHGNCWLHCGTAVWRSAWRSETSWVLSAACPRPSSHWTSRPTQLHQEQIDSFVDRSLMLVTALSPVIGYDKASTIAHKANDEGITLRAAALALGITPADFDRIVDPKTMVGDPRGDLGL